MKLKLSTRFMRNLASKLLSRFIYKKFGCKVNVYINDLEYQTIDGDTTLKLNLEAKMDSNEFIHLMKEIDAD